MPEKVFLGLDYPSGITNPYDDVHYMSHFTSHYGGILSRIGGYSNSSGKIKFNMYEISGGVPTNLIWADDTGIDCVGGKSNYLDVSSEFISVQAGEKYALGGITDSTTGAITYYPQQDSIRTLKTGLNYETFSAPALLSGYSTQTGRTSVYSFLAWGWEPPIIVSSGSSLIQDGQTGITLTGTDFMDDGIALELCDGPIYSTATKVSQIVTDQTDTTLEFTAAKGSLGQGIHYLFVTTSLGQRNAVGYQISLMGYDYGRNIPQQGDVWHFDDTNGGNIEVTNGIVTMTKFIESAVYLCWFGGNFRDDGSQSTEKLQWWGNEDEPVSRQYRGRLQSVIMGSPLTSAKLVQIENAAVSDLKDGLPKSLISEVSVSASAHIPKRVDLTANIVTKSGTSYEVNVGVDL
jgi:hypothetical protein